VPKSIKEITVYVIAHSLPLGDFSIVSQFLDLIKIPQASSQVFKRTRKPHSKQITHELVKNQVPIHVRKPLSQVEVRLLLAPLSVSELCPQYGNAAAALELESDVRSRLSEVLATPSQVSLKMSLLLASLGERK